MDTMASQITSLTIVYSTVYSGADQRKHQSSASLAFVRRIYRGPVTSPHKWPVMRKMFPLDDVIMILNISFTKIIDNYAFDIAANDITLSVKAPSQRGPQDNLLLVITMPS